MSQLKEAARLALDALRKSWAIAPTPDYAWVAIDALEAALALPDAEPVGRNGMTCRVALINLINAAGKKDPQPWRDARQDAVDALAATKPAIAPEPVRMTNDELRDVIAASKHVEGYILPFSFACEIEAAVLAKLKGQP